MIGQKHLLRERAQELQARIRHIERHGGTDAEVDEVKREAEQLLEWRDEIDSQEEMRKRIESLHASWGSAGGSLASKARETDGFFYGAPAVINAKAVITDSGDAAPRREGGIQPLSLDERYAYPNIPQQNLGNETRVEALVQNARTLAAPGAMRQAIDGSALKPESTVAAELRSFTPQMVATVSELLPNAIVQLQAFSDLVDRTLREAYRASLDDYVVGQLVAQAGTVNNVGTDDFIRLRKAVTNLQAQGFAPSLAIVSPQLAEDLDLQRAEGATGRFMLEPSPRQSGFSPLWNLRVIPAKNVTNPIVLDARAAATLMTGAVSLSANPFEAFRNNQTRFRLEGPALLIVRQPLAIHVVAPPPP